MEWNEIYEKTKLEEIPWHSEKPPEFLVKNLDKIRRGKALDICCGAGLNSIFLAEKGFNVSGIDISEKAIEIAKAKAKEKGVKASFFVGNVLGLGYENAFDFVFDRGCFHHIEKSSKPLFVEKVFAALREKGNFLLIAFSEKNNFEKSVSKKDIFEYFSEYFEVGKIEESVHVQPDNEKIFLNNVLMTKRIEKK